MEQVQPPAPASPHRAASCPREELTHLLTDVMGINCHDRGLRPARNLLEQFGPSPALKMLGVSDLQEVDGIGQRRALRLSSAFRLVDYLGTCDDSEHLPLSGFAATLDRLRKQVAANETTLLACTANPDVDPITLSVGVGFGTQTPVGGYLAQLLGKGPREWWLVLFRPGGAPKRRERRMALKFREVARKLRIDLSSVTIVSGSSYWILATGSAPCCLRLPLGLHGTLTGLPEVNLQTGRA